MADLYVPLDVNAADDPKIIAAGDMGELVFYRSLQLSKRLQSDGVIARAHLRRLGATPKIAAILVEVGLWNIVDGGFLIVAFLKRNPSRAQVEEQRHADADRKARWRAGRPKNATRDNDGTDDPRDAGHEHRATRSESESDSESEFPPGGDVPSRPEPESSSRSPVVELVAAYVDEYRLAHGGEDPLRSWRDQAGQQAKNMLGCGVDRDDVQGCLVAAGREGKSPTVLPHLLADLQAERGRHARTESYFDDLEVAR